MPTFIIAYDAKADSNKKNPLSDVISKLGQNWHEVGTTVVLHSDEHTVEQLRDLLLPYVGDGGKLLVVKSGVEHAAAGLDEREAELLKRML